MEVDGCCVWGRERIMHRLSAWVNKLTKPSRVLVPFGGVSAAPGNVWQLCRVDSRLGAWCAIGIEIDTSTTKAMMPLPSKAQPRSGPHADGNGLLLLADSVGIDRCGFDNGVAHPL